MSYLNNTYGRGRFVNGIDYQQKLTAYASKFPNDSVMEWTWPDVGSGSAFAYSYPEIIYGGTPWGNPYGATGPWPQKVRDLTRLKVTYDVALGGNSNSYNLLLDIYTTHSASSVDGSHATEISFYPSSKDPNNMGGFHTFSWGKASVTKVGSEILIRPVTSGNAPLDILSATIDMKEIFQHLVSVGYLDPDTYLRGAEFGVEVQVPNIYNSLPHKGSLTIRTLSFDWI